MFIISPAWWRDKVNQIYWPTGDLTKRRCYEHGERAKVGAHHEDRLLMITGPLAIARKGSSGIRIENGAITGDDRRMQLKPCRRR